MRDGLKLSGTSVTPETFAQQIEVYLGSSGSPASPHFTDTVSEVPRHSVHLAEVLVVDNEQANLDLACSILEASGYDVIERPATVRGWKRQTGILQI
jgi:hypothetical protein